MFARALKTLGSLTVATAGCGLAYLAASFLLFELPDLLLAGLTSVSIEELRWRSSVPQLLPQVITQMPPEGSALLSALSRAGLVLSGAAWLGLSLWAAPRLRGWRRLLAAQAVLWMAILLVVFAGVVSGQRGGVTGALRALLPSSTALPWLAIAVGIGIAALALAGVYRTVRPLLDSTARTRAGRLGALLLWILLPAGLVTLLVLLAGLPWPYRRVLGSTFVWQLALWVVGLALLPGLPAALWRPRRAPALFERPKAAVALVLIFGLSYGTLLAHDDLRRLLRRGDFATHASSHWSLHLDQSVPENLELEAFARQADGRLEAIAERLGLEPPWPTLTAYLYSSAEAKQLMAGTDRPFTLEANPGSVHHLLSPAGQLTDERGDALALMQAVWGEPGSEAVARALARYAVGRFYGYDLAAYAGRIAHEESLYTLRETFQLDTDYLSPLARDALSGAWVAHMVDRYGQEAAETLYQQSLEEDSRQEFAAALGTTWQALERDWQSRLRSLESRHPAPAPAGSPSAPPFFHRGLSFTHEVGGRGGYGSDRAQQQLVRLRELGANSIVVVPYAFTRAPAETRIFFGTDERDDRVLRTLRRAQELGLRTALKPQLWARGFTGDIGFDNGDDFERWFSLYRRWLVHFARMAELHGVDLLVIGTELGGTTGHEAAWRTLIADVRRIYSGRLTYAANWGREFEQLAFWDALDYLGVNMYYPLAAPGQALRPDSPRVQELAEKFASLAARFGKPVLFTEVGYPALASAAAEPWRQGAAAHDPAPALQAQCYQTVFEAFYQQPWFAGLYWWKWPSNGAAYQAFSPLDKPAAEVLARWYGAPRREKPGRAPETGVYSSK
ncbi:MAG: hypothetical protein ACE5HB_03945 [Terriglobia bacterium]